MRNGSAKSKTCRAQAKTTCYRMLTLFENFTPIQTPIMAKARAKARTTARASATLDWRSKDQKEAGAGKGDGWKGAEQEVLVDEEGAEGRKVKSEVKWKTSGITIA